MSRKNFSALFFISGVLIFAIAFLNLGFNFSASAGEKPVLMILSSKTCPACKQLEKVIKQLNKNYPNIKTRVLYAENPKNVKYFYEYDVEYVPTLIFKDLDGEVIAEEVGYMSQKQIINTFKKSGVKVK